MVKRTTLELGGKSPNIVFADCDSEFSTRSVDDDSTADSISSGHSCGNVSLRPVLQPGPMLLRYVLTFAHALDGREHLSSRLAGSRTYVEEKIYDEFVQRSIERTKKRKVGDPFDESTEQGPQVSDLFPARRLRIGSSRSSQISHEQMDKILDLIESGKKAGARLVAGGARQGDKGFFVQPTLFADVQDDHRIAREEVNAPTAQSPLHFFPIRSSDR